MSVGIWHDRCWQRIAEIHASLPGNATLKERKEALKNGYPFGERAYWPYKAWLKARRQYLAKYEPPKGVPEWALKGWE